MPQLLLNNNNDIKDDKITRIIKLIHYSAIGKEGKHDKTINCSYNRILLGHIAIHSL